jgi:hypothetical protein
MKKVVLDSAPGPKFAPIIAKTTGSFASHFQFNKTRGWEEEKTN